MTPTAPTARLFGTDGVRGLANGDLTAPLAMALAGAAAEVLAESGLGHRPVAVLGRDPRASGEMLSAAVTAGLTAAGADVLDAGVLPTPAIAHLVAAVDADVGVMISASHNPMPDNGIKLFAAGGHKLGDQVEDRIAAHLHQLQHRPTGAGIGRVRNLEHAVDRYLAHLAAASPQRLDGLRVVVDCAHGAASVVGPAAYRAAGAEVIALYAEPDGLNINDGCGSTHPEDLMAAVVAHGADLGVAHDGDADRCLAVDAAGALVDGDQIVAVLAIAMRDAGQLVHNTLVTTVMSNLGLHLAMRDAGIAVRTTGVGDRYVLEELRAGGFALGGEQSGHVVLPGHSTTGDGVLTALSLMAQLARTGCSLSDLASVVQLLPQVLINVRVSDRDAASGAAAVHAAVAVAEAELGDTGRVLLRPSGTEQLIRVMVEAPTPYTAREVAERLARVVAAGQGGT